MVHVQYYPTILLLTLALAHAAVIPAPPCPTFPSYLSHVSSSNPHAIPPACRNTCAPLIHLAGGCSTDSGACMRKYCESNAVDVFVRCHACKAKGSAEVSGEEEVQMRWLAENYRGSCAGRSAEDEPENAAASPASPSPTADHDASVVGPTPITASGSAEQGMRLEWRVMVAATFLGTLIAVG